MNKLLLVRHGSTSLNEVKGTMRGWLQEPLDKHGQKEAMSAAHTIRTEYPDLKSLYASDLYRVRESAHFIEMATGVQPEFTRNLRPWNPGVYQGKVIKDIGKVIEYYVDHRTEKAPQGESIQDFLDRLLTFMPKVFTEVESGVSPTACVTSLRPIEAILGWIDAGMVGDKIDPDRLIASKETIGPSGVIEVSQKPNKDWKYAIIRGQGRNQGTLS